MDTKNPYDELLTEQQLAQRIGCSKSKLRQDRCRGRGVPFIKLTGRLVRYRASDLQAYLEANRITPYAQSLERRNR